MGSSVLNEEQQLHRRSQALWDHLLQTEHRAQELAQETQRLKRIKDEAKALVMNKHPDLFPASQDYMGGGGGFGDPLSDDSQTSYMTQDLREIRNLLNHKPKPSHDLDSRLAQFRETVHRETGVPPQGALNDGYGGYAWPRDCVPVPVETLKRLVAVESSLGNAAATSGPKGSNNKNRARSKGRGGGRLPHYYHQHQAAGQKHQIADDTSNDAADLSQEQAEEETENDEEEGEEEEEEEEIQVVKKPVPTNQRRPKKLPRQPKPSPNALEESEIPKQIMIAHPDKVESLFPGGYHQEQHVRRVETTAAPFQHPQQLHEDTSVPKPLPRGSQLQQQSALQLQQPPQPVAGRREHEGEGESSANVYQTPPVFVGVAAGQSAPPGTTAPAPHSSWIPNVAAANFSFNNQQQQQQQPQLDRGPLEGATSPEPSQKEENELEAGEVGAGGRKLEVGFATSPEENFMLDSKAVEDKLYSAESSSSAREDEEEDSSLGPGANARGHNGNHNDKSQTFLSQLANQLQGGQGSDSSSTSSPSSSSGPPPKGNAGRATIPTNPLADYAAKTKNKFALRMQSDSDSYVAPGARQQQQVEEEDEEAKDAPQIESGLSGPDELGDDDFWG